MMDLIGDIVEKEVEAPVAPTFLSTPAKARGFPEPKAKSSWKQRQEKKPEEDHKATNGGYEIDDSTGMKRLPKDQQKLNYDHLSEAEKIHLENIEILSNMSEAQRLREKEELLGSMDPKILQSLLLRSEKKLSKNAQKPEYQGYGDWIGGDKGGESWQEPTLNKSAVDDALGIKPALKHGNSAPSSPKMVRFDPVSTVKYDEKIQDDEWEDIENLDEIAPPSYQIVKEADAISKEEAISNVHFLKPEAESEEDYRIDLNDPDFNEKLHEKYFPDLPKDTEKLKWMESLPHISTDDLVFDNVAELRFDFKGDLIVPSNNDKIDTSKGLHHHSESPALAGYTLKELAHLSRSTMAGQRCIAIRTLGRILHKLGKGKYNIVPEFFGDEDEQGESPVHPDVDAFKKASTEFDQMFWGLIDELRIIETLQEAADETVTKNVSVENYAIEALWLWKQGGGNTRHAN
jgi:hypothetical protein